MYAVNSSFQHCVQLKQMIQTRASQELTRIAEFLTLVLVFPADASWMSSLAVVTDRSFLTSAV